MSDNASVYKICPQCGQSVSVAAKFCPTCGTPFAEETADFVAYERYQDTSGTPPYNMEDTVPYVPLGNLSPEDGYGGMHPGPDQSGRAYADASEESAEPDIPDFHRGRSSRTEEASAPGVRKNPIPDKNRGKRLIATVAAAIVLLAVVAAGLLMAFRLGMLGSQETEDPMMLAQSRYDQKDYSAAISQLEKIIADGNATVETYELLADAYADSEDADAAADAYLRGYQDLQESTLRKSAINSYLRLGDTARAEGDLAKAKEYYDLVLSELDASNSVAISSLANLKDLESSSPSPSPSTEPDTENTTPSPAVSGSESDLPGTSEENSSGAGEESGSGGIHEGEAGVIPTPTPTTSTPTPSTPTPTSTTPTPATPTPASESAGFMLNGHKYELIIGNFTWWDAKADAERRGGHLVSINSEEEFRQCGALATSNHIVFLWLGSYVDDVSEWPAAGWVTGEPMEYSAWYPGEPSGGSEYYLSMFSVNGTWYYNDAANSITEYAGKRGYILEIDG